MNAGLSAGTGVGARAGVGVAASAGVGVGAGGTILEEKYPEAVSTPTTTPVTASRLSPTTKGMEVVVAAAEVLAAPAVVVLVVPRVGVSTAGVGTLPPPAAMTGLLGLLSLGAILGSIFFFV